MVMIRSVSSQARVVYKGIAKQHYVVYKLVMSMESPRVATAHMPWHGVSAKHESTIGLDAGPACDCSSAHKKHEGYRKSIATVTGARCK